MHHVELAWALIEVADRHLDESARFDIYIALGAGELSAVIRDLRQVAARERAVLAAEVMAALQQWWEAHDDTDDGHAVAFVSEQRTPVLQQKIGLCDVTQPPQCGIAPLTVNRTYLPPDRIR